MTSLFSHASKFVNTHRGNPPGDLNDVDLATDEDLTVFDLERLQLDEGGAVVGTTAVINGQQLTLSGGKLPPSIEPTFEVHKANILAAANCTSCVLIEEVDADGKKRRTHLGSAFFVAENLLITAGHNIVGVSGRVTRIWITSPGREHVQRGQIAQRKLPTIDCKVVGTIYKRNGDHSKDIAILDSGSFRHSSYLPLSSLVPLANAEVHVVGYPGEIRYEWIETHSGLTSHLEGKEEAMRLLPNGRLTVTRGTTEAGSDTLPYHISTCPGMGGSCVLYNGDVIGKTQLAHSYQIGVHIGQYDKNIQNLTMALTFSGDEIQRFLRKHRLTIK